MFYVYILTNHQKSVLYIGVTNDLHRRLLEHKNSAGNPGTFTGKYYCYHLLYYEQHQNVQLAIARETELKKWSRKKKEQLVSSINPQWNFLEI